MKGNALRRLPCNCVTETLQFALYNALAGPLTEVLGMAVMCTAMAASAYLVVRQETHILGVDKLPIIRSAHPR